MTSLIVAWWKVLLLFFISTAYLKTLGFCSRVSYSCLNDSGVVWQTTLYSPLFLFTSLKKKKNLTIKKNSNVFFTFYIASIIFYYYSNKKIYYKTKLFFFLISNFKFINKAQRGATLIHGKYTRAPLKGRNR
jgi:hypothetical protein